MNGNWGDDFATVEVDPDVLRDYAAICDRAAGMFDPSAFLYDTGISESAFSSWRSFNELSNDLGGGPPQMTGEGLSDMYNQIQMATHQRLSTIQDTVEELAMAVSQTAQAFVDQDASNSDSIADTYDPDVDIAPDVHPQGS